MDSDEYTDTCKLIQTAHQFAVELRTTFPEFAGVLDPWASLDIKSPEWTTVMVPFLLNVFPPHFFDIMFKSDTLFAAQDAPLYLLPALNFRHLMSVDGIAPEIQETIWDYLKSILVLVIPLVKDKSQFRDAAHLFDSVPEEELGERIYEAFKTCNPLFPDITEGEGDENTGGGEGADADTGVDTGVGVEEVEDSAAKSADRMKGMLERIMGSKLGQLSKTLMEELRPEIESMFPDLNLDDESTKTDVFKLLMKNPGKMISLIKKAKTRMEYKIKRGEISREELMEDMTELMKDGDMKKEMEAMMRQMMGGGKGRMNPNAMRSEMAKHAQRNRMRQKRDKKQQSDFFGGGITAGTTSVAEPATTGGPVVEHFRVENDTEILTSKRPQTEEEIAAIVAELEKDQRLRQQGAIKAKGTKGAKGKKK